MAISVRTNVESMNAQRQLSKTQMTMSSHFQRLSSGYRINSAADDAAGLAVSEKFKANIRSYAVAERNANDGISMVQTAESSLSEVTEIVGRLRELAVQSRNDTLGSSERGYLNTEFGKLKEEITRLASVSDFNGQKVLAGTAGSSGTVKFQVGISNTASDQITVSFSTVSLATLSISASSISSSSTASAAITKLDTALATVSSRRATFGAQLNRLGVAASALATARENTSAANSRIRDVDVAEETAALARTQILQQAGVSMLAQANQLPSIAMSLLR